MSIWNTFFNVGLTRLRKNYQADALIPGTRLWFVSGSVKDGSYSAYYQCTLYVIVGPDGIMFASTFWLPLFMSYYLLIPWQAISDATLRREWYQFTVDEVLISLYSERVADAVRANSL